MARLKKGILGGVSGKVGNVVGGSWKGVDYLRSIPSSVNSSNTVLQQGQRVKFSLLMQFLRPMKEIVRLGFHAHAGKMTAFNAAMSYNYNHAITGDYTTGFALAYSDLRLSLGDLEPISGVVAESTEAAKLSLNWEDNSAVSGAASTDILYVAVYNPLKNNAVVRINAALREDLTLDVMLPAAYSGDTVHIYTGFIATEGLLGKASRNRVSESVYAGPLQIA